jgi:uncharacterized pyridoxal phosphate-containing UPF0001 family protein
MNRLQEALPKKKALAELDLTWHFIGHLQTNKAKEQWIISIGSNAWIAQILLSNSNQNASRTVPVLIEVKLSENQTNPA